MDVYAYNLWNFLYVGDTKKKKSEAGKIES